MSIFSLDRHDKRDFNYKPRFREVNGGIRDENDEIDTAKMAERIHRSWASKRKAKRFNSSFTFSLFISMAVVLLVVYVVYKFFLEKFL